MKALFLLMSLFGVTCMGQNLDGRYVWTCSGTARQVLTLTGNTFTTKIFRPAESANALAEWTGTFSMTDSSETFSKTRDVKPLSNNDREALLDNCQWIDLEGKLERVQFPGSAFPIDLRKSGGSTSTS